MVIDSKFNPHLYLQRGSDNYRVERPSGHAVAQFPTKEDAQNALVSSGYAFVKPMNVRSDWYSILLK